MEKRYYYTDPLAAAWMCQAFAFDVRIDEPEGKPFLEAITTRGVDTFGGAIAANNYTRFYIHSDSIPLLEPKEGDLTSHGILRNVRSRKGVQEWENYVIQRAGKPFHWPECEEL